MTPLSVGAVSPSSDDAEVLVSIRGQMGIYCVRVCPCLTEEVCTTDDADYATAPPPPLPTSVPGRFGVTGSTPAEKDQRPAEDLSTATEHCATLPVTKQNWCRRPAASGGPLRTQKGCALLRHVKGLDVSSAASVVWI